MKKTIAIVSLIAFIATVVAKPTDSDDDLIDQLKRILEERYENNDDVSLRAMDGTDSSTSGADGTAGDTPAIETAKEKEEDKEELKQEEEEEKEKEEEQKHEEEEEEMDKEAAGTAATGGEELEQGLDEGKQNGANEQDGPDVKDMLHKGWDMLNELQRVSVGLNLENNPIKDNQNPRAALHDLLVQMFEFDGLTERVIRELLQSLSPEKDVCGQMFSEGEDRTLERVTNCFIMRFTQVLSLIEHLKTVTSASDLKIEDLVRLTSLERELFAASYEVFRILKEEDPSVSLPDIMGEKEAAYLLMQEGGSKPSETQTSDGSSTGQDTTGTGQSPSGPEEGSSGPGESSGSDGEGGKPIDDSGKTEGTSVGTSKRVLKEDLLARLARKLEDLLQRKR